jgi:pyruvate, water dikinase
MTLTQVLGSLLIFIFCPLLGGLPLISWITYALTRQRLRQLGTKNISVSAAFYHGGTGVGILAVGSEAFKGIAAVLLARHFFPDQPEWHMMALLALVYGRYWLGKGAGTTNAVWGYTIHDPLAGFLVFLLSGIAFTILREKQQGRLASLILLPLVTALLHPNAPALIVMTIALSFMLGWIYQHIPDDLELAVNEAQGSTKSMFKFFRGDRVAATLDQPLSPQKVGAKAATLAELKRAGYPVPPGWVLAAGADPTPLIEFLQPTAESPLVVRSSAVGEDAETASAAGQYETVLNITRQDELLDAILRCLNSYDRAAAAQYRRERGLPEAPMNVLIQPQILGVFSGVAFSRDPIAQQGDAVVIEALPGDAAPVVAGQITPQAYRVIMPHPVSNAVGLLPAEVEFAIEGAGDLPPRLLQQVAYLARQLEQRYHGIPQDIEWTSDRRDRVWLLQARPITTMLPIWTRKIAAEVIPGAIRPLTWSINRPLTCGVWGKLFALGLGDRARGLNVNTLATLHYSHAYFNASLLGDLFRRMGLPAESLEFLTLGAKFHRPPLRSTLRNLPGLLRLARREWQLERDFQRDDRQIFTPALTELAQSVLAELSPPELLHRIDRILALLEITTFYSIMAPLSAALRKSLAKVDDAAIDNRKTPEVAALRTLQELAIAAQPMLDRDGGMNRWKNAAAGQGEYGEIVAALFAILTKNSEGQAILAQFGQILEQYGYLSEVGTDIAIPTWKEDPQPIKALFAQFCLHPPTSAPPPQHRRQVQRRFDLKGRVTEVYSKLLAELRWSFVALEQIWLQSGLLTASGDIFFLEFAEIRSLIASPLTDAPLAQFTLINHRKAQFTQDQQRDRVPSLVYGDDPPAPQFPLTDRSTLRQLQGIGASPGSVEGQIKILKSWQGVDITKATILVVPYTDSGWAPLLARAGGLIAEVGGRLSHGAIVAREYRIPAVMNIHNATHLLQDGQRVRLDGRSGQVEILADDTSIIERKPGVAE